MVSPEEKLKTIINAWAVTEGLTVGALVITLSQAKVEGRIELRQPPAKNGRKRKFRHSDRPLTDEDWEKIMHLPWKDEWYRVILEEVRGTPDLSLPARFSSDFKGMNTSTNFNVIFRACSAGYRFTSKGGDWARGPFRLVAGKE